MSYRDVDPTPLVVIAVLHVEDRPFQRVCVVGRRRSRPVPRRDPLLSLGVLVCPALQEASQCVSQAVVACEDASTALAGGAVVAVVVQLLVADCTAVSAELAGGA